MTVGQRFGVEVRKLAFPTFFHTDHPRMGSMNQGVFLFKEEL